MVLTSVLEAFDAREAPLKRLPGGQGTTWSAGPLILKPTDNEVEATWTAELYATLPERGFRVPRPVKSRQGTYVAQGWTAWAYIMGEPDLAGRWHEKLVVCNAFHRALEGVPRPAFLGQRQDPWSRADHLTWGAEAPKVHPWLRDPVERLWRLLEPLTLTSQLIHGDISGNIMFADGQLPAVIDLAPYWRPPGFAAAVLVADAAVWEGANPEELFALTTAVEERDQLVLRAELRRLLELDGHALADGTKPCHLEEAEHHLPFVTFLERRLTRRAHNDVSWPLGAAPIMPWMPNDPAFYDRESVFDTYLEHRAWVDNPNATMERPTFYELAGNLANLDIIDLGCGYGDFGLEALEAGARSYHGVEASQRMVERARQTLLDTGARIEQQRLEDWQPSGKHVDLVTARLVLHYVADLVPVLASVAAALKTGGRFIFSVEHPVLTSCSKSLTKGRRTSWEVDDYFAEGPRTYPWLGQEVTKYHRTLETQLRLLQDAELVFEALREGQPESAHFSDASEYERRKRVPLFLIVRARKP